MSYCRGLVSQAMMKRQKRPHVRKNPALGAQHLNALAPTRTSTPNDGSVNTLSDKEGSDKNGKVPKQVENISKIMRNSVTKFHFFTSTDLTYGSFVRPIWHIAFSPPLDTVQHCCLFSISFRGRSKLNKAAGSRQLPKSDFDRGQRIFCSTWKPHEKETFPTFFRNMSIKFFQRSQG